MENTIACFGQPSETDGGSFRRGTTSKSSNCCGCSAGVDVEELVKLEIFSGDSDLNIRANSMPWSQWSLTVLSYFGKFNQTATRLLQRVETNVENPIIADNTTMTGAEIRLSIQLYCVLALTCRKRALQVVQQVPRGYGFEAWRRLCRKFGQHPPARSRGMPQALLSSTKSAELKRVGPSVEKQRKCMRGTMKKWRNLASHAKSSTISMILCRNVSLSRRKSTTCFGVSPFFRRKVAFLLDVKQKHSFYRRKSTKKIRQGQLL